MTMGHGCGRLRGRPSIVLSIACSLIALAACASTDTTTGRPSPTASVQIKFAKLGERVATGFGNFVVVHAYEAPIETDRPQPNQIYAAIDVEACGGPHPREGTGVDPYFFLLEIPGNVGLRPVDPVKSPALRRAAIVANRCVRGWVSYVVPQDRRPVYAVFASSAVAKWKIP